MRFDTYLRGALYILLKDKYTQFYYLCVTAGCKFGFYHFTR